MERILVDSSAWVEFLRSGTHPVCDRIADLLDEDRVAMCGVVEMELLAGVRAAERPRLARLLSALPFLEVVHDDWTSAGVLLASLRSRGVTIPSTDALIAACCLRHQVALLTLDRHFDAVDGLAREPVGAGALEPQRR
jgi:predicted nucleic acid-binding protein